VLLFIIEIDYANDMANIESINDRSYNQLNNSEDDTEHSSDLRNELSNGVDLPFMVQYFIIQKVVAAIIDLNFLIGIVNIIISSVLMSIVVLLANRPCWFLYNVIIFILIVI